MHCLILCVMGGGGGHEACRPCPAQKDRSIAFFKERTFERTTQPVRRPTLLSLLSLLSPPPRTLSPLHRTLRDVVIALGPCSRVPPAHFVGPSSSSRVGEWGALSLKCRYSVASCPSASSAVSAARQIQRGVQHTRTSRLANYATRSQPFASCRRSCAHSIPATTPPALPGITSDCKHQSESYKLPYQPWRG